MNKISLCIYTISWDYHSVQKNFVRSWTWYVWLSSFLWFFYCSSDKVVLFSRSWSRIHPVPATASRVLELYMFTSMYNWRKCSFAMKMQLNSAMMVQDANYCSNVKDKSLSNNFFLCILFLIFDWLLYNIIWLPLKYSLLQCKLQDIEKKIVEDGRQ